MNAKIRHLECLPQSNTCNITHLNWRWQAQTRRLWSIVHKFIILWNWTRILPTSDLLVGAMDLLPHSRYRHSFFFTLFERPSFNYKSCFNVFERCLMVPVNSSTYLHANWKFQFLVKCSNGLQCSGQFYRLTLVHDMRRHQPCRTCSNDTKDLSVILLETFVSSRVCETIKHDRNEASKNENF